MDCVSPNYQTSEYNPNTYALFIELAIKKILKPYAVLSFIIPNSWLNGKYFTKLRSLVSDSNGIELINLKDKAFDEIVETVILLTQKASNHQNLTLKEYTGESTFEKTNQEIKWGENPFEKHNEIFVDRILKNEKSIKDFCIVYRGVETKENAKWLSNNQANDNWKPILLGKDVQKYCYNYSGTYVNFIPKDLKSNANIEFYTRPKILMRRTGNSIIACSDFNNMIALKNLYLIIPKESKQLSLILHQLNSKLFNYIHKNLTTGENKAFAQFPAHYVESLPCIIEESLLCESDILLSKINATCNGMDREDIEKQINKMVYKLYNLTEEEINIVEEK